MAEQVAWLASIYAGMKRNGAEYSGNSKCSVGEKARGSSSGGGEGSNDTVSDSEGTTSEGDSSVDGESASGDGFRTALCRMVMADGSTDTMSPGFNLMAALVCYNI